jgi:hypothetical protein
MAVEEHRRIALHRAATDSWGEEVADILMDSIAPSGHELATRQDIDGILAAMDAMDQRWDERLTAMEERWQMRIDGLRDELSAVLERRITDAVNTQTRALVISVLVALVAISGLAFGLN